MYENLNDKEVKALFERGNNFIRMGNLTAAVRDYSIVLAHWPDFAPAYFNRGFARQHGERDLGGAISDYTAALQHKPQFPEALINRAIAHQQGGDPAAALADYTAAIAQAPDSAQAYVNRGELYFAQGDFALALADFQAAHLLKAGYRYAIAGRALAHYALGESAAAYELWADLLNRDESLGQLDHLARELGWAGPLLDWAARLLADYRAQFGV
jgi:tetratricopeptide (TPR) repeat protein